MWARRWRGCCSENARSWRSRYTITFSVTGLATGRHGAALDPDGLALEQALALAASGESLAGLSRVPAPGNAHEFILASRADVLFENTPVSYETGQPAIDHLRTALQAGMHAVTANKGPVVHAYEPLKALAAAQGRKFYFESTVMDGAPIFSLYREALPAAGLRAVPGHLELDHEPDPDPDGGRGDLRAGRRPCPVDRHR